MVWWLFSKKGELNGLRDEVKKSFSAVKQDFGRVSEWISHLNSRDKHHLDSVEELKQRIEVMEGEFSDIKNFMTFFSTRMSKQLFKQQQTGVDKQTAVEGVQTPVQTGVQTAFLNNLSVMERAIVWTLLNTEMKLSCEDIASVLGKERSTIRGQLNTIKQKNEGLIGEILEKNGRKRYYIPEEVREVVFSDMKVGRTSKRVKKEQK